MAALVRETLSHVLHWEDLIVLCCILDFNAQPFFINALTFNSCRDFCAWQHGVELSSHALVLGVPGAGAAAWQLFEGRSWGRSSWLCALFKTGR